MSPWSALRASATLALYLPLLACHQLASFSGQHDGGSVPLPVDGSVTVGGWTCCKVETLPPSQKAEVGLLALHDVWATSVDRAYMVGTVSHPNTHDVVLPYEKGSANPWKTDALVHHPDSAPNRLTSVTSALDQVFIGSASGADTGILYQLRSGLIECAQQVPSIALWSDGQQVLALSDNALRIRDARDCAKDRTLALPSSLLPAVVWGTPSELFVAGQDPAASNPAPLLRASREASEFPGARQVGSEASGTLGDIAGIWASSSSPVFAIGKKTTEARSRLAASGRTPLCDGGENDQWRLCRNGALPEVAEDIWAFDESMVVIVGANGMVRLGTPQGWRSIPIGLGAHLRAVHGAEDSERNLRALFIVGESDEVNGGVALRLVLTPQ